MSRIDGLNEARQWLTNRVDLTAANAAARVDSTCTLRAHRQFPEPGYVREPRFSRE